MATSSSVSSSDKSNKYVCSLCGQFARTSYKGVLRHIAEIHSFNPNFHITCGLGPDKCPETYTKYDSFRSHVYRKHREELTTSTICAREPVLDTGHNNGRATPPLHQQHDDLFIRSAPTMDTTVKHAAAMFILKSMEERKISQVSVCPCRLTHSCTPDHITLYGCSLRMALCTLIY